MPLNYTRIKNWRFEAVRQTYTLRDVILYALSVGLGADPLDPAQLRFVLENNLRVFPTMATVLAMHPGFWTPGLDAGIDWVKVLHGEQRTRFHRPLPVGGTVTSQARVTHVVDKGAEKGALVVTECEIRDAGDNTLLATASATVFCRADGGFGQGDAPPLALSPVPDRAPDASCTMPTQPQAALLYRLNGDANLLHADPAVAKAAGYPRPILHGLCTYGLAAHALLKTLAGLDPDRLAWLDVRFTAPFYPGETLRVDMWTGAGDEVRFQATAVERNTIVLDHGSAGIR